MTVSRLQLVPHGPPAVEALHAAVDAAKGGDALSPVTVTPPSVWSGLSLRRELAAAAGLVNVRFLPLSRVAELLGAPRLASDGRRPLTAVVEYASVRAALAADPGIFAEVAGHAATEDALVATLRELRAVSPDTEERLVATGPRGASVVALARARREFTAGFYDEEDLYEAASRAADEGAAALSDLGTVVAHLPRSLSPGQVALLEALARAGRLFLVLGLTGDDSADLPTRALADRFGPSLGPARGPEGLAGAAAGEVPHAHRVILAPDPTEEVRAVIRDVAERLAAGHPLHRVAVVSRHEDPYRLILHDLLGEAGIPYHGPAWRRLGQTVAGRALRKLLRLASGDLARHEVMAWLHSAPILEAPGGGPVPAAAWDALSREAGVVRGVREWQRRLAGLAAQIEARRRGTPGVPDGGPPDGAEAPGSSGPPTNDADDRALLDRLRRFVDELAHNLRRVPEGSWAALSVWASDLLVRYLGTASERSGRWPSEEDDAFERVVEALGELATLDAIEPSPRLPTFARAVDALLREPASRAGHFGEGLFVGGLGDLEGTVFDVVYVLGMVEGEVPPRGHDDPLLPDRDREQAGGGLPLRQARVTEERRRFLAALAAGSHRVLLAPRADPRAQQQRFPSVWLLEEASRLAGRPLRVDDLDQLHDLHDLAAEPVVRIPSAFAGLTEATEPASPAERDLQELTTLRAAGLPVDRHPLVADRPEVRAGFRAASERAGGVAGGWTGFAGPVGPVVTGAPEPLAPTSLERWAACPFRYFLEHVLEVREFERPEDIEQLGAAERGRVVHEVLERFVAERLPSVTPEQRWDAPARLRLREIAAEVCADYEARGRTGRRLLWEHQREHLLAQLVRVLDADERRRAESGVAPVAVEFSFGKGEEPPVEVEVGGGTAVRLRGVIDRVDCSAAGDRLVVIDYKTGSDRGYTTLGDDPVVRGTLLQLPVYALAARRLAPEAEEVEAYYWFVSDRGRYRLRGYTVTPERLDRFRAVLAVIVEGIERGVFPARPGAETYHGYENCTYCPYDRVCPAERAEIWARLRDHPDVRAYRELAEGDAPPAEPGGEADAPPAEPGGEPTAEDAG